MISRSHSNNTNSSQRGIAYLTTMLVLAFIAASLAGGTYIYQAHAKDGTNVITRIVDTLHGTATLTGVVTVNPVSPVCIADKPCTAAITNHTIEALDLSGNIAASTKTDSKGKYTLRLHPGRYTLVLVPAVGLGVGTPVLVVGGTNVVDVTLDSGIR